MSSMERVQMFDCQMDAATMEDTVTHICDAIDRGDFLQHGAINVGKLVNMQNNPDLHAAVNACDVISIDGMGLVWSGRLLGLPIPERVTGIDLFRQLIARSAQRGYPVYLLGAREEIVQETARVLQSEHPELILAGYHHGYFWDDETAVVEEIRASGAKLLFVAITSPRKEVFIETWKNDFGVNFAMGVGGTFDVVAGKVKRAPGWMQAAGLEWFYRVLQEPQRMFKRYLTTNAKFAWMLTRSLIQRNH